MISTQRKRRLKLKWQIKPLNVSHQTNILITLDLRSPTLHTQFTIPSLRLTIITTIIWHPAPIMQPRTLDTRHHKISLKTDLWTETKVQTQLISSRTTTITTVFSCRKHQTAWLDRPSWDQRLSTATATMASMVLTQKLHRQKTQRWFQTTAVTVLGAPVLVIINCHFPTRHRFIRALTAQFIIHRLRSTAHTTTWLPRSFPTKTFRASRIRTVAKALELLNLSTPPGILKKVKVLIELVKFSLCRTEKCL